MRKSLPFALLIVVAAFVPAACGSKSPAVPTLSVDAGFALGAVDGGPAPSGAPTSAPIASGSAPASSGSASAAPSVSVVPALLVAGLDAALDAAIAAQGAKDAPGMQAEGAPGHETLQPGGHFGMVATLQPGRCYTIIATSPSLQVSELEVRLLMLPLGIEAGRSPATDKNPAVLGRGKAATCPISIIPVPYRVDVTAKAGAGRIAVQVFSRAK